MIRPDDQPTEFDDDFVADLAQFDDLLQADADLPELVARLRQTQHILHQMGRAERDQTVTQSLSAASVDTSGENRRVDAVPPRRIGKFRLIRELGRGGCGIVFLARDERLDRDVALKLPQPGVLLDDDARKRFLREAKAAAKIEHPNIVPVLEAGEDGYLCYIAAAWCPGPTLAEWLRDLDEPPPFETAAEIVKQLASAAGQGHAIGVLHRDIKPGNVLLFGPPGDFTPKLTDFGLAKFSQDDQTHTRTGQMMGTATYMAPEQADAAATVNAAADVYSLGVVLYELLSGRPVFQGEGPYETLEMARRDDPVPPSRLRAGVPRDLETICLKCVDRSPVRRYANGSELADDLARFLDGTPILARRAGRVERARRWCARRPFAALSIFLAVVLFIGVAAAAVWFRDAEQKQRDARELAEHRLFDALLARAGRERLADRQGRRFAALRTIAEAGELAERIGIDDEQRLALRNEAIACLALVDLKRDVVQSGYPQGSDVTGIAIDSKVERYAIFEYGSIAVRRLDDNRLIRRITDLGCDHIPKEFRARLRFSPDGKKLGSTGSGRTWKYDAIPTRIWDLETGRVLLTQPAEALWNNDDLDFTPDSNAVAVGFGDGSVRLFDLSGKHKPCTLSTGSAAIALRFDPTGSRLAVSQARGWIRIFDVKTGKQVGVIGTAHAAQGLSWSPDGHFLAYGTGVRAYFYHVKTTRLDPLLGHRAIVTSTAFHPNGCMLATTGFDGQTRLWDPRTGELLLTVDGTALRFSRDGAKLAFGALGHKAGRWTVADAPECRTLGRFKLRGDHDLLDFDPTGRMLAVASLRGTLLFEAATGRKLATLPTGRTHLAKYLASGDLITVNRRSAQHWPLTVRPKSNAVTVAAGQPRDIETPAGVLRNASLSCDGRRLYVGTEEATAMTIVPLAGGKSRQIGDGAWDLTESSDSRIVAMTQWHGNSLLLDARDGSRLREFPGLRARATFSPDGSRLVLGTGADYRIFNTKTWETIRRIERNSSGVGLATAAFSADGKLLAFTDAPGLVRLVHGETLLNLATLTPPSSVIISCIALTPDGEYCAASTVDGRIFIWNLTAIRRKLRKLRLDW